MANIKGQRRDKVTPEIADFIMQQHNRRDINITGKEISALVFERFGVSISDQTMSRTIRRYKQEQADNQKQEYVQQNQQYEHMRQEYLYLRQEYEQLKNELYALKQFIHSFAAEQKASTLLHTKAHAPQKPISAQSLEPTREARNLASLRTPDMDFLAQFQ